jgi:pimeloyl-ACP methyl ester carboxylesterase
MRRAALLAAALLSLGAHAATSIPPGKWSFVFTDAKGRGAEAPMRVYTYRPRKCDEKCPLQFVLSGVQRNASQYRDYWELLADNYGVVIVAPEFDQRHWPRAAGYNLGEVERQDDPAKWAFSAIEHLFDEVREGRTDYRIFGHSAGAQFLHRMMIFRPDNRASVAVAANPGWYTMPEWRKDKPADAFPYSLVGSKAGEAELRKALQRRFVLMVGENDNDPNDEILQKYDDDIKKKQGATRVERAENFFKAATAAAGDLGVKFAWELVEVPDTAHDGAGMSKAAADFLYGKTGVAPSGTGSK